ncbi:MAG: PQQ-binding-like beta-propeller repeat protein [Bacteroidota bacterium]
MPSFRASLMAFLGLVLLLGMSSAQAQEATGPWPMFRHDAQRTGTTSLVGPDRPTTLWRYNLGGFSYSSPSIGPDGTVYVGSADSIFAVRPNGTARWTQAVSIGDFAIASPALGPETLYIGARDRRLYALDLTTGASRWGPRTFSEEVWTSPLLSNGQLVIGTFDFEVRGLDASSGADRWASPFVGAGEFVSSAAQGSDGTLYLGDFGNQLYALTSDGRLRWVFPTDSSIVATPAVAPDGKVIVGALDQFVYAVQDGRESWRFDAGGEVVASAAVTPDGLVYVAARTGTLYALNLSDGRERWRFTADDEVVASPTVDGTGTVYLGSLSGTLYALTPDGSLRWALALGSPIWSSPSIGPDQRLYVATTGTETAPGLLVAIGNRPFTVAPGDDPRGGDMPDDDQPADENEEETIIVDDLPFVPDRATLFYRRGGETTYQSTPVSPDAGVDGTFSGAIPADFVTLRGVEYYVEIEGEGQVLTVPPVDPQRNPLISRVRASDVTAATTLRARRYALVSVPVELADARVSAIFDDDFSSSRLRGRRLVAWSNFRQRFVDLAPTDTLAPGRSYFLITEAGGSFDVGTATSLSTEAPYVVTLDPGWNQVATPFAFPVAWSSVLRDDALSDLALFDGREYVQAPSLADTVRLRPWSGLLINNRTTSPQRLLIPPVEAGQPPVQAAKHRGGPDHSILHVEAYLAGTDQADRYNGVGFTSASTDHTILEAPPLEAGVRLSVGGPSQQDGPYAYHLRPRSTDGASWPLTLDAPDGGEVRLVPRLEGTLPAGFAYWIVDTDRREVLTPNADGVRLRLDEPTRHLQVVIGTPAFLARQHPEASLTPREPALAQNYPNPFNPETQIRYAVSEEGPVRLEVFNALGQRVAVLVEAAQAPGRYTATWRGTDGQGRPVASGLYLYRLTTGRTTLTQTMLLLR